MPADFSSFVVGRRIVKDGDLYLINRVDPLFFYLSTQAIDEKQSGGINNNDNKQQPQKQSWQPYDQFLEQSKLPPEVTKVISEKQLQHICVTFDNDELYFKFNVEKTLEWLKKKQERVLESLISQDQRNRKAKEMKYASTGANSTDQMGGSVSANFNFGEPDPAPPSTEKNSSSVTQSDTKALKMESFQIICNYLNQTWSKKFTEHLGCTMEQVTNSTTKKKDVAGISNESNIGAEHVNTEDDMNGSSAKKAAANKKAIADARTMGNKRLAKVSTKGMKSIGSFFGAGKAKKAKR